MAEEIRLPTQNELDTDKTATDFLPADSWLGTDTSPYRLDFEEHYKPPRYTLSLNGVPFAPLGGIHAITGQPGHGKTMTLAQLMAALLSGSCGGLRYEMADDIPHPKVLYIDTEMEKDNTIAQKNRVLELAHRPVNKNCDDFMVLMLREVEDSVETVNGKKERVPANVMRWRLTLKALYEFRPDVAFIDGVLDLVADFNDNKECQEVIYKCMQAASHYGISLWCLIHQNPNSEKLVGHLGSFVQRKVTDIFQTRKEKGTTVTFTVSQLKARGRDVENWAFEVSSASGWGLPQQIDVPQQQSSVVKKSESDVDLYDLARLLRQTIEPPRCKNWTQLRDAIKEHYRCGHTKAKNLIDIADANNIIIFPASGTKEITYNCANQYDKQQTDIQPEDNEAPF